MAVTKVEPQCVVVHQSDTITGWGRGLFVYTTGQLLFVGHLKTTQLCCQVNLTSVVFPLKVSCKAISSLRISLYTCHCISMMQSAWSHMPFLGVTFLL